MNVVQTDELEKWYGDVQALAGLNLTSAGKINGLIGPNGAGKTTTLLILLGLVRPTEGEASVLGLNCVKDSFAIRERVGVLHEKPRFPPQMTGIRFLRHIAKLHRCIDDQQVVLKLLDEVGLAEAGHRKIGTYSAGMVQRLGLVQALVGNPQLVILDEPTANLDPTGRSDILQLIQRLQQTRDIRFLISTHILPELEKVCDWVSIINKGTVTDQGPIQELLQRYTGSVYCVQVSTPQQLVDAFTDNPIVTSVRIHDDEAIFEVCDEEAFQQQVVKIAAKHGLGIKKLERVDDSLENIYLRALSAEESSGDE